MNKEAIQKALQAFQKQQAFAKQIQSLIANILPNQQQMAPQAEAQTSGNPSYTTELINYLNHAGRQTPDPSRLKDLGDVAINPDGGFYPIQDAPGNSMTNMYSVPKPYPWTDYDIARAYQEQLVRDRTTPGMDYGGRFLREYQSAPSEDARRNPSYYPSMRNPWQHYEPGPNWNKNGF